MAFDLKAVLRLDDKFSGPLRKIQRQAELNQRAIDRMKKSSDKASSSFGGIAKSSISAVKGVGKLHAAFVGLAGAIGAVVAAKKIFDSTIVAAAQYEQSAVTIDAMFNDKKIGKQYRDMVENIAIISPILDSQEILSSSRGFITKSKDLKDLEKMVKLTEKLAAYDPIQGTPGAAFALNEFMSGDLVSLVERFELSRTDLKPIKDLFADGQLTKGLEEFDKYLEKIGISQKLIEDMGSTTLGIWQQIKEGLAVTFRDMGAPALVHIRNFLGLVNDEIASGKLDGFKEWGAKALESLSESLISGIKSVAKWVQEIQNDPSFQEETTLFGKVKWVLENVYDRFLKWLDDGGRDQIATVASDLIQILVASVEASLEIIAPVAWKIGTAIGEGILAGAKSSITNSWLAQLMADPVGFTVNKGLSKIFGKNVDPFDHKGYMNFLNRDKGKSHNGGLNHVPYNGYSATLHRGEAVLTREEARQYRQGKGGNTYQFGDIVIQGGPTDKATVKRLLDAIANEIEAAGGAGA